MKAFIYEKYGPPDVLELREIEKPKPKENEILIKIIAASVNAYDWHIMKADPFFMRLMGSGLFKPKNNILGVDIAGIVEAVGENAGKLNPGDEIYGDVSGGGGGGFAEYVCVSEKTVTHKPASLSFEEAAAVPLAAITALQGLRDHGQIKSGQQVLINGASGGVGTFAVQIAKSYDTEVTAVCSTGKMDMVRSLGADQVIDYTREDFTKSGKTYDLIFAANGNRSVFAYSRALKPNGIYVVAGGSMSQFIQTALLGPFISMMGKKKIKSFVARPNQDDLNIMTELIESGKVKPLIDRRYPFSQLPDAIRYVDEGHAIGKVVINIGDILS
jgi:NADPH:quinone reductase-like Zn-dependent oxidoreductase